jgi:hypothetical protein
LTLLKGIVVCLVLANVGYFLWARGIAATAEVPAQQTPTATLTLKSESMDGARAANAGAGGAPAVSLPGSSAPAGAVAGGGVAGGGVPLSATTGGTAVPGGTADGNASGSGADSQVTAMPRADGAETRPALLTNVKRCISVGPFRDVSEAAHAATTLRAGGYDPRQRVADGEVWAGVWVYLPLPSSRSAGDQILSKLKAGGVDDALEMPGPNEGSVISLGLYSEPKRAQARVAQAQALGFNPGIADRKRTGNVYWIDIDLKPTDSLLNPADLQGETGHIVRLEVKGCPPISGAPP